MGSASFNSGCEVRRTHHDFNHQNSSLKHEDLNGSQYLETDDVGSYENPDALEEIPQRVNERRPDSQAALLPLRLAGRRAGGGWSTMRVTVAVRVTVTVAVRVQVAPLI